MRCRDSSSREYRRPEGVAFAFQSIGHGVEPAWPNRSRNLFSKNDCRAALADEVEPDGPEVAFVGEAFALPGRAERLAGAAPGPDRSIVGPAGKSQRVRPSADAGEEMTLGVATEIIRSNVNDTPGIDFTWRDKSSSHEISEPLSCIRIDLVVVGGHQNNRGSQP